MATATRILKTVAKLDKFDFETMTDAQEWAHRESLVFDTDSECQEECERLLKTVTVRERDDRR